MRCDYTGAVGISFHHIAEHLFFGFGIKLCFFYQINDVQNAVYQHHRRNDDDRHVAEMVASGEIDREKKEFW